MASRRRRRRGSGDSLDNYRRIIDRLEDSRARDGRRPRFTQPGGGPDIGRPAVGYGRPGGGMRTMEFRDRNGNGIDDRDEPGGSHYDEARYQNILKRKEERAAEKAAKPKNTEGKDRSVKGKKFGDMLRGRMRRF